jgi:hypothetical protein
VPEFDLTGDSEDGDQAETQDMDAWEEAYHRDIEKGVQPRAGESQQFPIDLCRLDTQHREWAGKYTGRLQAQEDGIMNWTRSRCNCSVGIQGIEQPGSRPATAIRIKDREVSAGEDMRTVGRLFSGAPLKKQASRLLGAPLISTALSRG